MTTGIGRVSLDTHPDRSRASVDDDRSFAPARIDLDENQTTSPAKSGHGPAANAIPHGP